MFQRLKAWLLHLANAKPPYQRMEFYALKVRLLQRYGRMVGHDIQEIKKECWGERRYAGYDSDDFRQVPCGPKCRRCGGTGMFDIRWIRLERWEWCGWTFHNPAGDIRKPCLQVQIHGRIEHPDYGRLSKEVCFWLYLICGEWRLLWHALRGSCCCGWYWWPMLNIQRVVFWTVLNLRWRKCWCGRWFPTWGSGWQICKRCRRRQQSVEFLHEQDIPF